MNRTSTDPARPTRLFAVLVLTAAIPCGQLLADEATAKQAVEHYDAARYAEARLLLEQLDSAGEAPGPLLYRLFYCQRATGDGPLSTQTLRRAVEQLEQEMTESTSLETGFYLATGYENLDRKDKAREVAATVLARVEAGELTADTGVDRFRLGKLYADQANEIEAANWYRSAILAFGKEGSGNSAYLVWANRYLADQALAMEDYSGAEIHLTEIVEHSAPTVEDLDRLAVTRVRNGMYREAAAAWKQAVPLNPGQSNRARYCARLAMLARKTELLETGPSGKAWDNMTREEFETVLKDQAALVREVRTEFLQTEELSEERRKEMDQALEASMQLFVSAGLEFALRGYDIREAAFLGGYAPLVFQPGEWKLDSGDTPAKQPTGKRRKKHEERFKQKSQENQ